MTGKNNRITHLVTIYKGRERSTEMMIIVYTHIDQNGIVYDPKKDRKQTVFDRFPEFYGENTVSRFAKHYRRKPS